MVRSPTSADHRPDVVSEGAPGELPRLGVGGLLAARSGRWSLRAKARSVRSPPPPLREGALA